jgi:hypothetical protein
MDFSFSFTRSDYQIQSVRRSYNHEKSAKSFKHQIEHGRMHRYTAAMRVALGQMVIGFSFTLNQYKVFP